MPWAATVRDKEGCSADGGADGVDWTPWTGPEGVPGTWRVGLASSIVVASEPSGDPTVADES